MGKFINFINTSLKYILFLLMTVLIISVFSQVLFRFVLNQPLAWTEELARYTLVWLTFLGAAYAMSLKAHIGVEFFVNKLPGSLHKILLFLSTLVSIAFFIILITQGYSMMTRSISQLSPVLKIPMGAVYAVIPFSGIILIINIISETIKVLFDKGGVGK